MTATITDLEQIADLDQVLACDTEGCEDEATYRHLIIRCHCASLMCTDCERLEHEDDNTWDVWICSTCGQRLGLGYGRWFYRTVPL